MPMIKKHNNRRAILQCTIEGNWSERCTWITIVQPHPVTAEHNSMQATNMQSTSSPDKDQQYVVKMSQSTSKVTTLWDKWLYFTFEVLLNIFQQNDATELIILEIFLQQLEQHFSQQLTIINGLKLKETMSVNKQVILFSCNNKHTFQTLINIQRWLKCTYSDVSIHKSKEKHLSSNMSSISWY